MTKEIQSLGFLNTGIFPVTILFSCGFDYEEIVSICREQGGDEWAIGIEEDRQLISEGTKLALRRDIIREGDKDLVLFYIILRDCFDFTDYSYCTLAHEVLHICQFMLPDILDRNREFECEAYLHTHIMSQCLKQIRGND